jgi:GTP-binding protein
MLPRPGFPANAGFARPPAVSKPAALPVILSADFIMEVRPGGQPPPPGPPEVAIAGRSNVGKSTLLNRLVGRRALARTSKTPGRTRGIMFYDLQVRWPGEAQAEPLRLVDLPGYGYAQVSQDERRSWQPLIEGYVAGRTTLVLFFALVDARREVEDEERQLLEWLGSLSVPHRLVVTKTDKLSSAARGQIEGRMRRALPAGAPAPLLVSGETGEGVDRMWSAIRHARAPVV